MADVVTVSIPHTGTYFTIKLFTDAGFTDGSLFYQARSDSHLYHGHMIKEAQIARALDLACEMPLVIPFRHPYRVANSWNMRGRPLPEMFECYRTLLDRFLPLKPYFMPVDSDRREEALQKLSDGVGVRLTTDWSVVNGMKNTHTTKLADITPTRQVVELARGLEPLMEDLY